MSLTDRHLILTAEGTPNGRQKSFTLKSQVMDLSFPCPGLEVHIPGGGITYLKVIPSSPDTSAMLLKQLPQGDGHLLLDHDRVVHVTGYREKLGSMIILKQKTAASKELSTLPDIETTSVSKSKPYPSFLALRPKLANQLPPRRRIVGATATVSTLVTVEGQPNTPTLAGKGGFRRGFP